MQLFQAAVTVAEYDTEIIKDGRERSNDDLKKYRGFVECSHKCERYYNLGCYWRCFYLHYYQIPKTENGLNTISYRMVNSNDHPGSDEDNISDIDEFTSHSQPQRCISRCTVYELGCLLRCLWHNDGGFKSIKKVFGADISRTRSMSGSKSISHFHSSSTSCSRSRR